MTYPVCPSCGLEYLPIPGIDACPFHDPNYVEPRVILMDECACGELKPTVAKQCGICRAAKKRRLGSKWGRYCACGAVKASGAAMCHTCRYGAAA